MLDLRNRVIAVLGMAFGATLRSPCQTWASAIGIAVLSPAYPYAPTPLRPVWHDRKARALGVFAVVCTAFGLAMRWPFALADIDTLALLVLFPGALAFVLAFAPRPATRANRIAKDLVTVWTALGIFGGSVLPLMIATVPVWLAVAVFAARIEASRHMWGDDP